MSSKTLTATLKFNTTQAENSLKRVQKLIEKVNKATTGKSTSSGIEKALQQRLIGEQKVKKAVAQTQLAEQKLATEKQKTALATEKVKNAQNAVKKSAEQTNREYSKSSSLLGSVGSKLKMLASTYLGIMGTKAAINTSDTITKAQNKLNNLNGGDTELTQQQMDKMYASANKVRMAYTDMLSNASKSMTLAGDAFQGNMDNAIRFQEIMAEAYTLGGASAEEMSTSMYQMIQALGAGTLAGDELRSVREGAPLAYKAIEKYVQGVMAQSDATKEYATKSLKDIAAEGLVTSEMVVAAVMDSGDKLDKQFQNTAMTFEQAWDRIKNSAVKAFEPVSNALSQMLNQAAKNGAFEKIEQAFVNIGKVLLIVFELICRTIQWVADNWNWLKHVLIIGLLVYASYLIVTTALAIKTAYLRIKAWILEHMAMLKVVGIIAVILIGIYLLIQVFQAWKQGAIDTCNAIVLALLIVAAVCFVIFGWVVALIIAGIAIVIWAFEYVCLLLAFLAAIIVDILSFILNVVIYVVQAIAAGVAWLCAAIWNIIAFIVNLVVGCTMTIGALAYNCIAGIVNVAMGLWNVISAICANIGIAFQNAWNFANSAFWEFVADCLDGLSAITDVIDAVAKALGADFSIGGLADSLHAKAKGYQQQSYVSVGGAWDKGMNTMQYADVGGALSTGLNTLDYANANTWASNTWDTVGKAHTGYVNPLEWGSAAMDWGSGVKDAVNNWGSQYQTGSADGASINSSWLDNLGNELGLDLSSLNGGLPNVTDPANDVTGAYNAPSVDDLINDALGKDVGDISDNTGKMADSMELTEEDLDYLRKLADMEWKKEYTTASITVDMSNYNNINGESDLDGIVTKLGDKLREELNVVANGVYT